MKKHWIHLAVWGMAAIASAADYNQTFDISRSVEADFNAAVQDAQAAGKRIFIDFGTEWCGPCKAFDRHVLRDPELNALLHDNFVVLKIRAWQSGENGRFQRRLAEPGGVPFFVVADQNGVLQMSFGYEPDDVKTMLQQALVYNRVDPAGAVDADEATSVLVPEHDTLRIATGTLEPIKGVRMKADYTVEEVSGERRARLLVANAPFGRRDLQTELGRTLQHDTWEEFLFPEPVNADYLLLAAEKAPVRVFELEYIMGEVFRKPADVSADELVHRKLLCREYHSPKGYSKVPIGPDESTQLVSEEAVDLFRTELTPDERGRKRGFLETTGYIRIDEPGIYVFRLNSIGLSKFSVGGIQLLKQMDYQTASAHTGTLQLEKGFYPYQVIFVPYYEGPVLDLEVKPPEGEFMPLPIDWLYVKRTDGVN